MEAMGVRVRREPGQTGNWDLGGPRLHHTRPEGARCPQTVMPGLDVVRGATGHNAGSAFQNPEREWGWEGWRVEHLEGIWREEPRKRSRDEGQK